MIFDQSSTYYEILEVAPDASAQDIRSAYQRLKAAYKKDNLALYSVMDSSETDELLAKVEEAFQILSDPDSRREYDERNGIYSRIEDKIVSIDRVPPMESNDDRDLLVPPATDFPTGQSVAPNSTLSQTENSGFVERRTLERRSLPSRRAVDVTAANPAANKPVDHLSEEIERETEWRGSFLKRVREFRRFSIDDLATQTKISKTYIHAIEEETYDKLPAAVFVRGFVVQISKILRLPSDQVAQAYMARYKR